jgi:hypothetical protein
LNLCKFSPFPINSTFVLFSQIVLVFCFIGLCAAATTPKPKTASKTKKDVKEKRDAAVTSGPYSYNTPQKSFQDQAHQQQKVAPIEYHQKQTQVEYQYKVVPQKQAQIEYEYQAVPQKQAQVEYQYQAAPQKVASLDHFQQKQPVQAQHFQHEGVQYSYPSVLEGYEGQSVKGLGDYGFSYPGYESFQQMPIEHYNAELDKINQALVNLQGYKFDSSSYKSPFPQESYSFGSSGYEFPQAYSPQQHQSFVSHSAPSAPAAAPQHFGFVQSPAALFVPQTVSISPKPTKIPDYASGHKGLGHFSTVSTIPLSAPAPTQAAYKPQSYEVPSYKIQSYESYKPQAYESHSYKPQAYETRYEAPVSHLYNHYQTERPFKASAYLGSTQVDSHSEQSIASHKPATEYLPPSKTYLPAKEPVKTYLPAKEPAKTYLPAREPAKTYLPAKEQYVPMKEQYAPMKEQYAPQHTPVEYQIQYVQIPQKSYLPAAESSYSPPKASPEPPKSSYLPPSAAAAPPKKQYLPPSQPSSNYLPPNNPYQSSYHTSSSHPQSYQHFQSEGSYESQEYQSVSSGHK